MSDLNAEVHLLLENISVPCVATLLLHAVRVCTVKPILTVCSVTLVKFQITTLCMRSGFLLFCKLMSLVLHGFHPVYCYNEMHKLLVNY
jgi:hypothetical protein